jgi:hypothetical protein
VAIIPGGATVGYRALTRALEEAFPVRFVGSSESDIDAASAVIVFPGGRRPERLRVPCLVLKGSRTHEERGASFTVEMSRCAQLDRPLHGQALTEHDRRPPTSLVTARGCRVLAVAAGKPIWTQSELDGIDHVTASSVPSELEDHEFLRDHMTSGRFWSLLPIAHFLKSICPSLSASSETLRACFVIDDPNPRFSSYGHISFLELAREAREAHYHVAIATIPLDLLLPGRAAVNVFQRYRTELSLVVHGNDHVHRELERPRSTAQTDRMLRSAVARVRRFEERAGIRVERVMCPPHGGCSGETLGGLSRHGFLGLAASRPFPWDGFSQHRDWRLGGWLPAQLTAGGFPVIPRIPITKNLDDLVFRAMLGLPLVIYCHQSDLSAGLEPFRAAAARVAALGDVQWSSLASIIHGNALCHEQDGAVIVTIYSRDVRVQMPAAHVVRVEIPRVFGDGEAVQVVVNGTSQPVTHRRDGGSFVVLANRPTGNELRIQIPAPSRGTTPTIRDWRPRAWPMIRRAMTETRDRARPLVGGLRG